MNKNDTFKKAYMATINEQPETIEEWPKEFATVDEMEAGLDGCKYAANDDLNYHVEQLKLAIYSAEELAGRTLEKIVVTADEECGILTYDAIFNGGVGFTASCDKYEWYS